MMLPEGDDRFQPRIVDHEGEAIGRIGRVERHVGGAGFQDAEQPDDHLDRTLYADAHERAGPHALPAQMPREAICPVLERRTR